MTNNKDVVLKLKEARGCLDQTILMFQGNPLNLKVVRQSQKVQNLLRDASYLIACRHLNECIADLLKKGRIDDAWIEMKRLHKLSFQEYE